MTSSALPPEILAAALAARILHDLSGPACGVASGLDLLVDPGQGRLGDAAIELAVSSARALLDLLEFHKVAFGATGEAVSADALHRLALTQFEGRRPQLEWVADVDPFPGPAAQAMLILVQISAATLAAGGRARATASCARAQIALGVEGQGPRATLQPEMLEGLEGRALSRGLAGRWAPSRYLAALVTAAGGALTANAGADRFSLAVTFPATGER